MSLVYTCFPCQSTPFPTVTALVYGTQLAWEIAKAGYQDHEKLADARRRATTEGSDLKTANDELKRQLSQKPSIITKTTMVPQEKQCWFVNDPALPPSSNKVTGAVTTTAVIIHCNYKLAASYKFIVEFDKDFIPGQLHVPDAMAFGARWEKRGMVFGWEQEGPPLSPNQIAILVVYGPTDQYPRAKGGIVQTDQTRTQLEEGHS